MQRIRISDPSFSYDPADPEGFRSGMFRFGPEVGAQQTGASVYELPPGQAVCPYHYEYAEEEWVLALEGRPSVRTPEGTEQIEPLDVVFFPRGPAGAHQIRNDTDSPFASSCGRRSSTRRPRRTRTATRSRSGRVTRPRT